MPELRCGPARSRSSTSVIALTGGSTFGCAFITSSENIDIAHSRRGPVRAHARILKIRATECQTDGERVTIRADLQNPRSCKSCRFAPLHLLITMINSLQQSGLAADPSGVIPDRTSRHHRPPVDRSAKAEGSSIWAPASIYLSDSNFLVFASSPSESIFVPMMPSSANCAISASESLRSPDRISLLCCPSVGAAALIA